MPTQKEILLRNPDKCLEHLRKTFGQPLMVKLFGPLDAKTEMFGYSKENSSAQYEFLIPLDWENHVNQKYPYLNIFIGFCDETQYFPLYERLKFQIKLNDLLYEYGQWDDELKNIFRNWRVILSSPKNKTEFDDWLQKYAIDQGRYHHYINILVDKYCDQTLLRASARGHYEILHDLLMRCSRIKKPINALQGAINQAAFFDRLHCLKRLMLEKGKFSAGDLLCNAVLLSNENRNKSTATLSFLISVGANIHTRANLPNMNFYSFTPLLVACAFGNIPAIHVLIDAGANVDDIGIIQRNFNFPQNLTAYTIANRYKHPEVHAILNGAFARQCKVFCYELLNALKDEEESKIIQKWYLAHIVHPHLVSFLLSDHFHSKQQHIDLLQFATESDITGIPTNPLSKYLKNHYLELKSKLNRTVDTVDIQDGTHRGTYQTKRPYLYAYGPQHLQCAVQKKYIDTTVKNLYSI